MSTLVFHVHRKIVTNAVVLQLSNFDAGETMKTVRPTVIAGGLGGHVPDAHFKMSKKIAQLTVVVYQLKTKCDDSERQLSDLTNHYEEEIALLLRDARAKLTEMRKFAQEERIRAASETTTVVLKCK